MGPRLIIILLPIGILLGFFVFYQLALTIVSSVVLLRSDNEVTPETVTRFAVLIPAHNEELLIGNLVDSIMNSDYPKSGYTVFVIADNCSDSTAAVSREHGANCLERFDDEKRGKPYALNWALGQISIDDYDAVTIIDADTEVDRAYFSGMNKALSRGADAIQGYFGVLNPDENWLTRLSVLPAALRYKLQCPAKAFLGLSCPLAGNGMVFSADLIKRLGWNAYSIAENWEYYAIVTLEDYVVQHESDAVIYSQVTPSLKEGKAQRTRWLKGRIDTISRYAGKLLAKSLRSGRLLYVDALIELVRPSHSMLFLSTIAYLLLCAAGWLFLSLPGYMVAFSAGMTVALGLVFVCGLIVEKAPLRTWLSLGMVPIYLVWKLLLTLRGVFSFKDREWIRTKRH